MKDGLMHVLVKGDIQTECLGNKSPVQLYQKLVYIHKVNKTNGQLWALEYVEGACLLI